MAAPAPDAAAAVATSDSDRAAVLAEFPQFDGTSLGLPADFILYSYNKLKG
jgi:hypothetical protein